MSFFMSLILYNPMEAGILLWCCYLFRKEEYRNLKFDWKKFVIDCYVLGTIFLIVQYPVSLFVGTVWYLLFSFIYSFVIMPAILFLYSHIVSLQRAFVVVLFLMISVIMIINLLDFSSTPYLEEKSILMELFGNIAVKIVQTILILGGISMKRQLKEIAKTGLGRTVSSTILCWGTPKMSAKLKDEIKNAK